MCGRWPRPFVPVNILSNQQPTGRKRGKVRIMEDLEHTGTTAEKLEQVGDDPQGGNLNGSDEEQQEPEQKERTFTQEDVDKIVQKRLAKERSKIAEMLRTEEKSSDLDEREQKIIERELKADARDRLDTEKLPRSLGDLLDYDSLEALNNSFELVTATFKKALGESLKPYMRQDTPRDGMFETGGTGGLMRNAFSLKR